MRLETTGNVGIGTNIIPEKLTVNGNILANGSISGTSLNVVDIVTSGKEFKINTSVCLKGIDINDPLSRNEICGMGGNLFVQSELNNNYHTIFNYGNNGNVGIGTANPTGKLEVNGKAVFTGTSHFYRITALDGDSIIRFGDSTINMNTNTNTIYGSPTFLGFNRGLGLGSPTANGKATATVAIGTQSRAFGDYSNSIGFYVWSNAEKAITIGSGTGNAFLYNDKPNTLIIGFNSDVPTIYVSSSAGAGTSGQVGIGTTCIPVGYKMAVEGAIRSRKVRVDSDLWCDFVFEKKYKLMPILEVDKYITENKHLPNIPDAKTVVSEGIDVAEMMQLQMQKIEEMMLYIIELKKENEELRKMIEAKK